jgi:exosortase/archaeosortase family protein
VGKYWHVMGPVFAFVVLVAGLMAFYPWLVRAGWFEAVLDLHAWVFGSIFNLLGQKVYTQGDTIVSSDFAFKIVAECTALVPSLLFAAAVAVFPSSLGPKLWGITLGVLALLVVNTIRIVTLMYIAKLSPDMLELSHLIVWQGLMILAAVGLWVLWTRYVRKGSYA